MRKKIIILLIITFVFTLTYENMHEEYIIYAKTEKNIKNKQKKEKVTIFPKLIKTKKKITYSIPKKQNNFKAYMPYTALSRTSKQGELQKKAVTGEYGIRYVNNRMCIAVGTYYGLTGTKLDITLSNGTILKCIVGDSKSDIDTDKTNRVCKTNGSIIEFIIDSDQIDNRAKKMGNYSAIPDFSGEIVKIQKIK